MVLLTGFDSKMDGGIFTVFTQAINPSSGLIYIYVEYILGCVKWLTEYGINCIYSKVIFFSVNVCLHITVTLTSRIKVLRFCGTGK